MSDVDLFADQFSDSNDLIALTNALISPTIDLGLTFDDLFTDRWIDTAVGVQLDRLGDILGIARKGRTDDAYRDALRFQIFINTSNGDPETIIRATRELSQGTLIRYWENYPAGFELFTDGPNILNINGSVVENFTLVTDDSGLFVFDDGAELLLQTSYVPPEGLVQFLGRIAPVAIDYIALSFSLGETPLFGFGGDFVSTYLITDDTGDFELDDTGQLDVNTDEIGASADGFIGFGDFELQQFVLDNGEPLILNIPVNVFDMIVAVSDGMGGVTTEPFVLDDGFQFEFFTEMFENVLHDAEVAEDDGFGIPIPIDFVTDDTGPLQFLIRDQIGEQIELAVFDQNQPIIGGGKLCEAMTDNMNA